MNVVRPDGLIELAADILLKARKDYAAGPASKHYASAARFLESAGLLSPARTAAAGVAYPAEHSTSAGTHPLGEQ